MTTTHSGSHRKHIDSPLRHPLRLTPITPPHTPSSSSSSLSSLTSSPPSSSPPLPTKESHPPTPTPTPTPSSTSAPSSTPSTPPRPWQRNNPPTPDNVFQTLALIILDDVFFRNLAAFCYIYLLLQFLPLPVQLPLVQQNPHPTLTLALQIYATTEVIFHLIFLRRRRKLLSIEPPRLIPNHEERQRLMKRIFESFDRSPRKLGDWVRGWYYRVPEPKSLEVRGWLGKLVDYVGLGVDKGGKREWRLRGRRWDGKNRGPEIMLDELREGNVMDLMAANFFNLTLTEVAESEVLSAELWDDYVQWSELMLGKGRLFRKGYNEDLGRVCHMLDPVQIDHRPLLFYLMTITASTVARLTLCVFGFQQYTLPYDPSSSSPPKRTKTLTDELLFLIHHGRNQVYYFHPGVSHPDSGLVCRFLRVFYRSHRSDPKEEQRGGGKVKVNAKGQDPKSPLVLHTGLGDIAGLFHFAIGLLLAHGPDRPVFIVGNAHVGLRLIDTAASVHGDDQGDEEADGEGEKKDDRMLIGQDLWTFQEGYGKKTRSGFPDILVSATAFRRMLYHHGFASSPVIPDRRDRRSFDEPESKYGPGADGAGDRDGQAILISHSLGTMLASVLVRLDPTLMAYSILMDPIPIMLHHPHTVRSFVFKEARTVAERMVRVISREMGIAHCIQRGLFWFVGVAFVDVGDGPGESVLNGTDAKKGTDSDGHGRRRRGEKDDGEGSLALRDTMDPEKTHVILSEEDCIVNSPLVAEYLEKGNVEYTWLDGALHGSIMMDPVHFRSTVDVIGRLTRRVDERRKVELEKREREREVLRRKKEQEEEEEEMLEKKKKALTTRRPSNHLMRAASVPIHGFRLLSDKSRNQPPQFQPPSPTTYLNSSPTASAYSNSRIRSLRDSSSPSAGRHGARPRSTSYCPAVANLNSSGSHHHFHSFEPMRSASPVRMLGAGIEGFGGLGGGSGSGAPGMSRSMSTGSETELITF